MIIFIKLYKIKNIFSKNQLLLIIFDINIIEYLTSIIEV